MFSCNHIIRRLKGYLLLLPLITGAFLPHLCQAAMNEGQVRAAVIFHIIALTQGPESKIPHHTLSRIVVVGKDPGGLADTLTGKIKESAAATGKIIFIPSLATADQTKALTVALQECQVLYLTRDGMQYLSQIPSLLPQQPILTIGETKDFCENGTGMICLTIENQKLAIHINRKLATEAGFNFSAELLRHAVLIDK